jgi:hypothetical protein
MNDFYQHFESIARANPGQIDAEADLKVSAGADGAKSSNFCKINHISTVFLENSSGKTTPQRMAVPIWSSVPLVIARRQRFTYPQAIQIDEGSIHLLARTVPRQASPTRAA